MKHSFTILAVAPGRREIGIATFRGHELSYFALKRIGNKGSDKLLKMECGALMQEFVTAFNPRVVVVRAISGYQKTSTRLEPILNAIRLQARRNRIPVVDVSLAQVKLTLCHTERPTQGQAFRNLADIYPETRQFLDRPSMWQRRYYEPLLSAVAVGVVHLKTNSES